MGEEFLTRASFAGVPHQLLHSDDIGQATIFPLSPKEACKLYWMLKTLNISYEYEINGVAIARNILVESTAIPKKRMIAPATFYKTGYDSYTQTSYAVEMFLNCVYFSAQDNSKIGFKLQIEEADSFNLIRLGLRSIPNMNNVSKTFDFLGAPITAYLNYNPQMISAASLKSFSVAAEFFEI